MNKKLLTLAVAAAMAAPAIASAEAIMYGKLNMSVDYFDVEQNALVRSPYDGRLYPSTVQSFKGWTLNGTNGAGSSRANRLGVKGSEDLGNGLKAIYQIEFGVRMANEADNDIDNGDADSAVTMRNSFVGLAGDWGTFLVGRHDTPLKISTGKLDLFSDTVADYNGTVGFDDIRADNAIAYISPSWNGLQFAGAVVPGGGATTGGEYNLYSDSISEAWSLAAIYKNGPFYASAAYESLGKQLGAGTATVEGDLFANVGLGGFILPGEYFDPTTGSNLSPVDGYVVVADPTGDYIDSNGDTYSVVAGGSSFLVPNSDYTKWRIGLGLLDWNGFTLTGIYEQHDNDRFIKDSNPKLWQVQAGYAFGNSMVKAMYGQYSSDLKFQAVTDVQENVKNFFQDKDKDTWAIGYDYNFSKRTTAYMVYTEVSEDRLDQKDWSAFSLG
jgi:predicted porin